MTAQRLSKELEALPDLNPIESPLTDATPEALARVMSRNNGKAALVSAEGGLINILSGSYSDQPNIDVILQGYSGEAVAVERISREPVRVDKALLAISLCVQPQVLERFLANETLLERGLCARFLYCVPLSMLGHRDARAAAMVPYSISANYQQILSRLTAQALQPGSHELALTPAALEVYYSWAAEVEQNIALGAAWNGLANGWEGKLLGNTVRLSGLLKLADNPDEDYPITETHFLSAVKLARYFADHALIATGKASGLTPAASEVLAEIVKQNEPSFSPASLRQHLRFRKRFNDISKVDDALHVLEKAGYVRLSLPPEWSGIGRRPEALYEVHPDLLKES